MNLGEKALYIVELIKSSILVILPLAILRKTQIQNAECGICATLCDKFGSPSFMLRYEKMSYNDLAFYVAETFLKNRLVALFKPIVGKLSDRNAPLIKSDDI